MDAGAKVRVTTDDLRELRVFVTLPPAQLAKADAATVPFELVVRDAASGHETARATLFQRPSANPGSAP